MELYIIFSIIGFFIGIFILRAIIFSAINRADITEQITKLNTTLTKIYMFGSYANELAVKAENEKAEAEAEEEP